MHVLLAPMPVAVRLQLRRLLHAPPGLQVLAQLMEGQHALPALAGAGPHAVVFDAEHVTQALLDHCLAHEGIAVCLLLWQTGAPPEVASVHAGKLRWVQRPIQLEAEQAHGEFTQAMRRALGCTGPVVATPARASGVAPGGPLRAPPGWNVLAVGASTGGPEALKTLLCGLAGMGRQIDFPILITQHMGEGFVEPLAQSLAHHAGIPCQVAQEGEPLCSGVAYLAPAGKHLAIQMNGPVAMLRLDDGAPENYCKPAVDVMLRALAQHAALRPLVVVLSGMGQDGLRGCQQLHAQGALILAQDRATSVVWGMPGAVAQAGICHAVVPLQEMARRIMELK